LLGVGQRLEAGRQGELDGVVHRRQGERRGNSHLDLNGQISTYVAAYKAGKRNSMGKYTDPSRNWYSAPFLSGAPDGVGRCHAKVLGREWKCTFKAGKIQGMPAGMRGGNK
jgi:hypothetical protein